MASARAGAALHSEGSHMILDKFRRPNASTRRSLVVLGVVSIYAGAALLISAPASIAAPGGFNPEGANTYTGSGTLSANCPNALAGTPGSDPAVKILNSALNTAASFGPGGTVHYHDLVNPNADSHNFELQDCVVAYPAGQFDESQIDPTTGVLTGVTKQQLTHK